MAFNFFQRNIILHRLLRALDLYYTHDTCAYRDFGATILSVQFWQGQAFICECLCLCSFSLSCCRFKCFRFTLFRSVWMTEYLSLFAPTDFYFTFLWWNTQTVCITKFSDWQICVSPFNDDNLIVHFFDFVFILNWYETNITESERLYSINATAKIEHFSHNANEYVSFYYDKSARTSDTFIEIVPSRKKCFDFVSTHGCCHLTYGLTVEHIFNSQSNII